MSPSVATETVLLVLNPWGLLVVTTNSPLAGSYDALVGVKEVVHPVTLIALGDAPTNWCPYPPPLITAPVVALTNWWVYWSLNPADVTFKVIDVELVPVIETAVSNTLSLFLG